MLKRAASAEPEVRATRCYTIGCGLEHFEQHTVIVLLVTLGATKANAFSRQRAGDERRLAFAHDAIAFMREPGDYAGFFCLHGLLGHALFITRASDLRFPRSQVLREMRL